MELLLTVQGHIFIIIKCAFRLPVWKFPGPGLDYVHLSRLQMTASQAGEGLWEWELPFGVQVGDLLSKRSKEMSTENNNGPHHSQSNFKEGITTPIDTQAEDILGGEDKWPSHRQSYGS